jgi:hypothetical protein
MKCGSTVLKSKESLLPFPECEAGNVPASLPPFSLLYPVILKQILADKIKNRTVYSNRKFVRSSCSLMVLNIALIDDIKEILVRKLKCTVPLAKNNKMKTCHTGNIRSFSSPSNRICQP